MHATLETGLMEEKVVVCLDVRSLLHDSEPSRGICIGCGALATILEFLVFELQLQVVLQFFFFVFIMY